MGSPAPSRSIRSRGGLAVLALIVVAGAAIGIWLIPRSASSVAAGPADATPATATAPSASIAPPAVATPAEPSPTGDDGPVALAGTISSSGQGTFHDSDIRVDVRLASSAVVTSGASLDVDVTVTDIGSHDVLLNGGTCTPASMVGYVALPSSPDGKSWAGLAGTFKAFARNAARGPGGGAVSGPSWIDATVSGLTPCPVRQPLQPGGSISGRLEWPADVLPLLGGDRPLAAPDGVVGYSIRLEYLPFPAGGGLVYRHQLELKGTLTVRGGRRLISPWQAVDALVADAGFTRWLGAEPSSTWSTMNVILINPAREEAIVPAGTSWEIDLTRTRGGRTSCSPSSMPTRGRCAPSTSAPGPVRPRADQGPGIRIVSPL